MVDVLNNVIYGFGVALQPLNLMYCFFGVLIGTLVGVLPGLGPAAAIALLLPTTFKFTPVAATIMLAGIYYGAMYGGSTTSILVNIPGEAASVVTCLDGYQMARKGRAGPALGIAAFGSFIAGTIAVIALTFVGPVLADLALAFGPPEYFSLMIVGIMVLTYLSGGSMIKALMMAGIGVMLSGVGMDTISGQYRFTFDLPSLLDGVGVVPVAMGLFGISEVLLNLETEMKRDILATKVKNIFPSLKDWAVSIWSIIRGSILGFFLGIIPGGGAVIASFASYAIEKKMSKHPEEFGKGAIQGVAGPEAANNAGAGGSFIPLLTLGIPANPVMAILLGALMIHGLQPGPLLMNDVPDLFWGTIVSMYIGNGMLLVLNLPLIPLWIKVLKVPYYLLYPLILLFCLIGAYSLENNSDDMLTMLIFGILGFLMKKFHYDGAPMILALVLGQKLETSLRRSLIMSHGDFSTFITRPISLAFLIIALALLIIPIITQRRKLSQLEEG
ncbi:MAG: transporter [Deltaproteobacteria bacterium HGW-Deltaproteobacteria-15]|jgi:putative tricarboxylic transport membrane protein|nr:MAG: transporter [Deltaproteobacteria bacterium HGW-Deltaproteobacteria-15]